MKLQKTLILCVILMATPGHAMDRQRQLPSGGEVYCYDLINGLRAHEKEQAWAQNKTEVYEAQKHVHRTRRKNVADDLRYRIKDLNQKINRAKAQEKACVQNEKKVYAAQKHVDDALLSLENLYAIQSQFVEGKQALRKMHDTYRDLYTLSNAAMGRKINQQEMSDLMVKMNKSMEKSCELYQRLFPNEESKVNAIRKMPEGTVLEMQAKWYSAMQLLETQLLNLPTKLQDLSNQADPSTDAMNSKKVNELKKALNTLEQQMVQKWNNGAFKCALQAKLERKNLEEQKSELVKIRRERANWTAIQAHDEAEKVCEQMNGEMMQMIQLQRQNLSLKEFAKWMKTDCEYTIKEMQCIQHLYNYDSKNTKFALLDDPEEIQKIEKEIDFTNKKIQECEGLVLQIDSLDKLITSNVTLLRQQRKRELASEEVKELKKINTMIPASKKKVESLKSGFCNYISKVDHTQKQQQQQMREKAFMYRDMYRDMIDQLKSWSEKVQSLTGEMVTCDTPSTGSEERQKLWDRAIEQEQDLKQVVGKWENTHKEYMGYVGDLEKNFNYYFEGDTDWQNVMKALEQEVSEKHTIFKGNIETLKENMRRLDETLNTTLGQTRQQQYEAEKNNFMKKVEMYRARIAELKSGGAKIHLLTKKIVNCYASSISDSERQKLWNCGKQQEQEMMQVVDKYREARNEYNEAWDSLYKNFSACWTDETDLKGVVPGLEREDSETIGIVNGNMSRFNEHMGDLREFFRNKELQELKKETSPEEKKEQDLQEVESTRQKIKQDQEPDSSNL